MSDGPTLQAEDVTGSLADFIKQASGADTVAVTGGTLLAGGAIQENRAFDLEIFGGDHAGKLAVVVRTEAPASVGESLPLAAQFTLLQVAERAGVIVPKPYWFCADPDVVGREFYVMGRVSGQALGGRMVRNRPHDALADALARHLAALHTVRPPQAELEFLALPSASPAMDAIAKYRGYLDAEADPHPVLEWGLRWLELNAPTTADIVLCHHDYRTGNYMVDDGALTAILDWEFAGWSDFHEDIGWFCARCWRFGADDCEAGGIADRDTFYRAYEEASGRTIDRDVVRYWEVMAHVRWAIIALQQSHRHISGAEPSLELALIGHRVPELDLEILRLTGAA